MNFILHFFCVGCNAQNTQRIIQTTTQLLITQKGTDMPNAEMMSPLRRARLNRNLTLDDAARALGKGFDTGALSRYERQVHLPRPQKAKKLADFYEIPLEQVLLPAANS